MKKSHFKYLLLIAILIFINLIGFLFTLLFYELTYSLNEFLDYSSILFLIVTGIIIAKFIQKKELSLVHSLIIIYLIIAFIRAFEVFYFKSSLGIMWCSVGSAQSLLNLLFQQGEEYIYWWTVPLFPILQPLSILCFYKILCKTKNTKNNSLC